MKYYVIVILGLIAGLLTGCSKTVIIRGFAYEPNVVNQLHSGISTTQNVLETLGTPTTQSDFGEPTWYYISSKYDKVAFFTPKTVERHVVAIKFDSYGVVREIDHYDLTKGHNLEFSSDATRTKGDDTRMIKQFIENIGKFNKAPGAKKPR